MEPPKEKDEETPDGEVKGIVKKVGELTIEDFLALHPELNLKEMMTSLCDSYNETKNLSEELFTDSIIETVKKNRSF